MAAVRSFGLGSGAQVRQLSALMISALMGLALVSVIGSIIMLVLVLVLVGMLLITKTE